VKCIVVFCHSTMEDEIRQALDEVECQHYVGVNKAFARDADERRLDSRYHPGADVVLMAFVEDDRVDDVIAAIGSLSAREHSAHTRLAVLPVERFV
jgi:hypothetical protein